MTKLILVGGVLGTAFSAIFVRFAEAPSQVLAMYRMLFTVTLLLPMLLRTSRKEWRSLRPGTMLLCALSGIFLGLHFTCYFESLRLTSIASAVVLVDVEVFFVALGSILFLREKVSGGAWLGMAVTFGGSVIVALGDAGGTSSLLGDFLAVMGAVCSAAYTLIGRKCRERLTTTLYTFFVYLFAGLTVLAGMAVQHVSPLGYGLRDYAAALGMAVCCTLLGHSIFSWGLKYEKPSFVSIVKLLEPVFASLLGILFFCEIPSLSSVLGGVIVIGGILATVRRL